MLISINHGQEYPKEDALGTAGCLRCCLYIHMPPCAALSEGHWCSEQSSPGPGTALAARHCCSHGPQVPANALHTAPSALLNRECSCCHGRAFMPRGWMALRGLPREWKRWCISSVGVCDAAGLTWMLLSGTAGPGLCLLGHHLTLGCGWVILGVPVTTQGRDVL